MEIWDYGMIAARMYDEHILKMEMSEEPTPACIQKGGSPGMEIASNPMSMKFASIRSA